MNRSDKDPARRPKVEQGDAITDDFAATAGDDAADDVDGAAEQATHSSAADDPADIESGFERALAEQQDKYLRLAAEYDNYRKRSVRERQDASVRGQAELLRSLLDALDDLSRFAHVDPGTTDTKTVVDGVAMVERKMLKALTSRSDQPRRPDVRPLDDGSGGNRAGALCGGRSRCREGLSTRLSIQRPTAASRARRREAVERLRTY